MSMRANKYYILLALGAVIGILTSCNREEDINPSVPFLGKWKLNNVVIHQYKNGNTEIDTSITTYSQLEEVEFLSSGKYLDPQYALLPYWHTLFHTQLSLGTWEVGADLNTLVFDRNETDVVLGVNDVTSETLNLIYWDLANPQIHDTSNFAYCKQMGEYYGQSDAIKAFNITGYSNGYIYGYDYGFAEGYALNYGTLDYDLFFSYYSAYSIEYFNNYFGGGDAQFDTGHNDGYNDGYIAGANYAISNDDGSIKSYELEYVLSK